MRVARRSGCQRAHPSLDQPTLACREGRHGHCNGQRGRGGPAAGALRATGGGVQRAQVGCGGGHGGPRVYTRAKCWTCRGVFYLPSAWCARHAWPNVASRHIQCSHPCPWDRHVHEALSGAVRAAAQREVAAGGGECLLLALEALRVSTVVVPAPEAMATRAVAAKCCCNSLCRACSKEAWSRHTVCALLGCVARRRQWQRQSHWQRLVAAAGNPLQSGLRAVAAAAQPLQTGAPVMKPAPAGCCVFWCGYTTSSRSPSESSSCSGRGSCHWRGQSSRASQVRMSVWADRRLERLTRTLGAVLTHACVLGHTTGLPGLGHEHPRRFHCADCYFLSPCTTAFRAHPLSNGMQVWLWWRAWSRMCGSSWRVCGPSPGRWVAGQVGG